jgi:hypothetical protein
MRERIFLDELSDCCLLKKVSALWTWLSNYVLTGCVFQADFPSLTMRVTLISRIPHSLAVFLGNLEEASNTDRKASLELIG